MTEHVNSIERISAGLKRGRPYVIRPPEADNLSAHRDHVYTEVLRAYGMHTLRITVALDAVAHTCRGTVSRWSGTSWELVFELPEDLAMAEDWQHPSDPYVEDFGVGRDYLLSLALRILL